MAEKLKSTFAVPKMDCASEENMVRMALAGEAGVVSLAFDLPARRLQVTHRGEPSTILAKLEPLGLGAKLAGSEPAPPARLSRSALSVPKMDCPSEENMIRMALRGAPGLRELSFDMPGREVTITHEGAADELVERLAPLRLGAVLVRSEQVDDEEKGAVDDAGEARLLRVLLAINAAMFAIELGVGLRAQSTGLIADSLDMFADAAVFGLALFAVGRSAAAKTRAARAAGYLQLALALASLAEVLRRFAFGSEPASGPMIGMGALALVANAACLVLVAKKKDAGSHMKASYIFSANDVIANAGVVAAGILVAWTGSPIPDLAIGAVVSVVVLGGALRILRLR